MIKAAICNRLSIAISVWKIKLQVTLQTANKKVINCGFNFHKD